MKTIPAAEAKNRFGELLDAAQKDPVMIEKHGRPVAVVISAEDFEQVQAMKLERLKALIQEGINSVEAGSVIDGKEAIRMLRERIK